MNWFGTSCKLVVRACLLVTGGCRLGNCCWHWLYYSAHAHVPPARPTPCCRSEQFAVLFYKNVLVNVRNYRATLLRLLSPL